jgi:hypothetical protein
MLEAIRVPSGRSDRHSYELTASSSEELIRALMLEHPIRHDGRFGCYMIPGVSPYSDLARSVECDVFHHFFGNTAEVMHDAYGAYEESSRFFLVVDRILERPAGTLRVIANSKRGLKSLNDIAQAPLCITESAVLEYHGIPSLDDCWDIGTLAVLKEYRGELQDHQVGTMLYGVLHRAALREGVHHAVTVLDRHAYTQLTQMLAIPFEPIVGSKPFDYLGSPKSRAAYLYFPKVASNVETHMSQLDDTTRRSLRPYVARVIYGEGVPDVVSVPHWR